MKKLNNLLLVALLFISAAVLGQTKLSGVVVDDFGEPLPGANVLEKGTTNGAASDFDGKFMLNVNAKSGTLVVSFVGYKSKEVAFTSANANVGTIQLEVSNLLDEIVVTGGGVIDLAEDRKTPIAVSTVTAAEIQSKSGAWDLPEVLKSTPSVQNIKAGGFGDGRMFLRGFDQTNTAFLLNGQPINSMEDGRMFWSNWSGVLDVSRALQVQRGLGSSKLAISSVGGTVNIVTKTIDKKEGGFIRQTVGNNAYTKTTAYYSTGVSEKGWSFAGMFGHWQGDGYVDFTHGQGQTYFFSVGYQPNENHTFNFMITGAPQWHAAAGRGSIGTFLDNGIRFNSWNRDDINSPNTLGNTGKYPGGRNIYHKPVANLSWDYTINDQSSLSTVLYGSLGRGAFASVTRDGSNGETYARGSFNNHNWFGLVSNYENQLNDNLTLNVGTDIRTYNGIHFRGAVELFNGGSVEFANDPNRPWEYNSFVGEPYTIDNDFGGISPWGMLFNPNNDHRQRIDRDYEEVITYYGLFGQLEYADDKISGFFQAALSNQDHQREEFYFTQQQGVSEKSEKVSNFGYNVKAGGSYVLAEQHKVFLNAGFYSRQPFHSDLFVNDRNSNALVNPAVENQDVLGLEGGYQFGSDKVDVNFNVYYTRWGNRTDFFSSGTPETPSFVLTQNRNVTQLHKGIELEVFTKPFEGMKLNGFASIGDWKFDGDATQSTFDQNGNTLTSNAVVSLDGKEVGGAAQTTAGVFASYRVVPSLTFDVTWNYYARLFSEGDLALELPSYNTMDLGLSFRPKLKERTFIKGIDFRVNVDNVFDELYLESLNGRDAASTNPAENWNGINRNNQGRFGYGITWNASMRINF
ncbi:carboxypeptidase-like regulatory domain-containing protein [uncultured Tenacibaculum sp.]|uniref:TonB-dependent receptor n=1 Tax=uncultured Tenacibaculum sp. TaxID=174713 RepID=UPI0026292687|nr:carboxypeptidase-like regulatory domain-containing protein [uncultured Tenacibaculum sp.]